MSSSSHAFDDGGSPQATYCSHPTTYNDPVIGPRTVSCGRHYSEHASEEDDVSSSTQYPCPCGKHLLTEEQRGLGCPSQEAHLLCNAVNRG